MTTPSYPFGDCQKLLNTMRKLDQREAACIESVRQRYRKHREELLAAAPKAVQSLVVAAIAEEVKADG